MIETLEVKPEVVAIPVNRFAHIVVKYPYIEMLSVMVTKPLSKTMYDDLEKALVPLRELAESFKDVRFNFEAFSTWKPEGRSGNVKTNVYFSRMTDQAPSLDEIEKLLKGKGFKYFKRY